MATSPLKGPTSAPDGSAGKAARTPGKGAGSKDTVTSIPTGTGDDGTGQHGRLFVVVAGVLFAVLSAVVAVLAALVSRMIWRPGPIAIPWGLALGVVASVAVVLVARSVTRRLGLVAAGTWIIATGLVLAGRPEGDYIFAQDGLGLGYLLICTIAVISAAAAGGAPR